MNTRPGPKPAPCGTLTAYKRHIRDGERPCLRCCDANALAEDDRRHAAERRQLLEAELAAYERRGRYRRSTPEWDGQPSYAERREYLDGGVA